MTLESPGRRGPLRHLRDLPEEVLFFGRLAIYGVAIGTLYWFLTYEAIGSVLLIALGGAAGVLTIILSRRRRREPGSAAASASASPAADTPALEGPFADAGGRLPSSSFAPLEVGVGLAVASLSFAFGAWLALAAIIPLLGGALTWLRAAERELWAVEADDDVAGRRS